MIAHRTFRRQLTAAFALLVIASNLHCIASAADTLERFVQGRNLAARLPGPMHIPVEECANESGCMCHGATLVSSVAASDWLNVAEDLLAVSPNMFATYVDPAIEFPCRLDLFPKPTLSGRKLRARLASLVI